MTDLLRAATRHTDPPVGQVRAVLERARDHLLGLQDEAGWWKGELATNVTMDAEDLLLRQFLGIRTDEQTAQTARWIRSQQRDDGSWTTFQGGSGDLSTTIEAYAALRLAGDPVDAAHMSAAAAFARGHGGIEASRVFTRIWLALFGQWPWPRLPAIPPELVLLPHWAPFNVYDFACWARQTIVPLSIVRALRPVRELGFTLDELRRRFPALAGPPSDDICYATTNRQQAVTAVAAESDVVLVLGSANSSNSRRLVEVAERAGARAHLVDDVGCVDLRWLAGATVVGLTAGTSAPARLVDEVIEALTGLGARDVAEHSATTEDVHFTLPKEIRQP